MFVEINGNQYNTLNFTAYRYLATKDHPIGLEIHYAGGTKLIKDFESESERSAFTENLGDTYLVLNDIAYNALYFTAYYTEDVMLPTPSYNVVIHYAGATKLIKKSSTEAERNEFVKILEELSISSKYDDTELREKIADLKEEVDGVVAATDVKDIVGTYAALEQYDTSKLGDNDIIKVLQDETREYAQTYYRWHKSEGTFSYIGKEGPYYTREQIDRKFEEVDQPIDNKTITKNSAQELQAVGVAESNKGTATKTWVGTQEEYDALASIDNDTLYYITDGVPEFGDGKTIAPNTEGLLQALGMIESNKGKVSKLWIGTKAEYDQIATKDEGTIYYLTDEEDIYATKKYVDDAVNNKQNTLVPGTNITIDENNVINAKGADKDNLTITENTDGELQSVGVLDSNTNTVTKVWTGTLAEYNAITSKDSGTIYYITDEEDTTATQEYVNNAIQTALGTIESELGGI